MYYRNLSEKDIDKLAVLSPFYNTVTHKWGKYTLWILKIANSISKQNIENILANCTQIQCDIEYFSKHKSLLGNDINLYLSFESLHNAVELHKQKHKQFDIYINELENRIFYAYKKLKKIQSTVVYEDNIWFIVAITNLYEHRKLSAIGKWCHTSKNALDLRINYHIFGPIYYILNKKDNYVLCNSYAKKYEISDQYDILPYLTKYGWKFNTNSENHIPDSNTIRLYLNVEKDWISFIDFIDLTYTIKNKILAFESEFLLKKQKRMLKKIIDNIISPLKKSIKNNVLILNTSNIKNFLKLLKYTPVSYHDKQIEAVINKKRTYEYTTYILPYAQQFLTSINYIVVNSNKYLNDKNFYHFYDNISYIGKIPDIKFK